MLEPTSMLACQRAAFSLPADVHYLNCGYMAPLSKRVEAAAIDALRKKRNPPLHTAADYFNPPDRVRAGFARLVNARDPERVAIVPSVSYAMAAATLNVPVARSQNVVVIGAEFPSAVLAWRRLARDRGATLRTVAAPAPQDCASSERAIVWNERLLNAIDDDTAAVVISHVHWSDGTRFDLGAVADRARHVGAALLIDGTQSVGALPFDLQQIRPDLLVCAGYKWLMGGYGLGVAYFGELFDNGLPVEDTWAGQVGSEDFTNLADYRDAYRADASRYDVGERASFVLVAMLAEALEELLGWGIANVQLYCAQLLEPWLDRFGALGLSAAPPEHRSAHLFGIRFSEPRDLKQIAARLAEWRVYVSVRGDALRVSPHIYNDEEDMAALFDALSDGGVPASP